MTQEATRPRFDDRRSDEEISLFELGSTVLENRFRIVAWAVGLSVLVGVLSLFEPSTYTTTATVVSAGVSSGPDSRLRALGAQFGIADIGGGGSAVPTASPVFLAQLAASPIILTRLLGDTLSVEGVGTVSLLDLVLREPAGAMAVGDREVQIRQRKAVRSLKEWIAVGRDRDTEAVRITVRSPWPEASHHVATRILEELNRFNLELGRAQAGHERRFVEDRLTQQADVLREAEGRLGSFLTANRNFQSSPNLSFEFERLQRDVALQQQVLATLAQSVEEVRIREVRDTPILSVIEPPAFPVLRDAKGRIRRVLLAFTAGLMIGIAIALARASFRRRRAGSDPEAERFATLVRQAVGGLYPRPLRRLPPKSDTR